MNTLIENCTIVTMDAGQTQQYFLGSVGIASNEIAMLACANNENYNAQVADFKASCDKVIDGIGCVLLPGFINIHTHSAMTMMRGYADDMPLMAWLNDKIWPFEGKMTRNDVRLGTEHAIGEMLLGGTTTFADMYWHQSAVGEVAVQTGIRAVLCPTFFDPVFERFTEEFAEVVGLYGSGQHSRISVMAAPHAPYTCSPENLQKAKEMCRKNALRMTIHVAETVDEIDIIQKQYGKTPIEHLDSLGVLDSETIAVHCVYLTDCDIEILARTGASVAHNPQSNMKLASGVSPVAKMLAAGVNVGLGTDGASSNNDLDMMEEVRTASLLQKLSTSNPCVLPAYQALSMMTTAGAKAIGMEGRLGIIKQGALADVVLIDIEKPHYYPRTDLIANIVYCGKSADVQTVIVDGEVVVENRKVLRSDVGAVCKAVDLRTKEIGGL